MTESFGTPALRPKVLTIAFWQTLITLPAAFSFEESIPSPPPDIALERIEIEGSPGYWMAGVAISDDAGNPIGWDRDVIVLEWQSGDVLYRFHGEGVELAGCWQPQSRWSGSGRKNGRIRTARELFAGMGCSVAAKALAVG